MREIKFKAWDKDDEEMKSFWVIRRTCWNNEHPQLKHLVDEHGNVLMQFTGLIDKNGKDIYEGDILKIPAGYIGDYLQKESIGLVEWTTEDIDNTSGFYLAAPDGIKWSDCEIIGNIYENPELLKVEFGEEC